MARMRTCEQCGGKSSPHIPRRRVDGKMLCEGCASLAPKVKTSAKTPSSDSGAYKKKSPQGSFDFWEGELAPEGMHPLQAPLPPSVWEKYNKHRELLGKPLLRPDHMADAWAKGGDSDPYSDEPSAPKGKPRQTRLRLWRRKRGSLQATAADQVEPHASGMNAAQLHQHLVEHHDFSPENATAIFNHDGPGGGLDGLKKNHEADHQSDAETSFPELTHAHAPAKDLPHPQGKDAVVQHLQDHHNVADWEVDIIGGDEASLKDYHDHQHSSTSFNPDHSHSEPGPGPDEEASDGYIHPHAQEMSAGQLKQHYIQHHNYSPEQASSVVTGMGLISAQNHHDDLHEADKAFGDLGHVHGVDEQGMHPHPKGMSQQELEQHLLDHHGLKPSGVDNVKSNGTHKSGNHTDHTNLLNWHTEHHTIYGQHGGDPHEHQEAPAEGPLHPPANTLNGKQLVQHLKEVHGLSPGDVLDALKSGGEKPLDGGTSAGHKWHDEQHAAGAPHAQDHSHEEFGVNGPEVLKHPKKYSNGALHSHLLTDHGIDPDHLENAINGTFSATDPSHIVHMLHNQAHADGQFENEHGHENWDGGAEIHPGHTDVGKPFWGAPPNNVHKSLAHLTAPVAEGGHGMTSGEVANKSGIDSWGAGDDVVHAAYEQLHGDLHQQGAAEHQHVPTIQPGVMSPEKAKKEKLKQHLKDYHGIQNPTNVEFEHGALHDPEAYAYKGHPGHEHPAWDKHGPVVQSLPSEYGGGDNTMPKYEPHHPHPTAMSKNQLQVHLMGHAAGANMVSNLGNHMLMSHEELIQQHALEHATGIAKPHTHEPVGLNDPLHDPQDPYYGHEPEIQTDTHPAIEGDSAAIAHIIKHHPNVTQEDYQTWGKSYQGTKPSVQAYHDALHAPDAKDGNGNKLPKVLDGHDHAPLNGPPTTIAVGDHLVKHHGLSQAQVASMTPAEFKAHHEQLHLKEPEFDLGHGHDYPGGPMRDPKVHLPNTHHELMRSDSKHPAVEEWYHGTGNDFEGAPKNATELMEGHGFWGNWGGGDWNNHVGTHWTSLHQMAQDFSQSGQQTTNNKGYSGAGRVIHARLHVRNPIVYNSLNHMAHDAYERLRASGHLQDGGRHDNDHDDDAGYNHCCSDALLEYAKGHHRDDGKYGLEAYRDSLRASGHDGILVRNQADSPHGHWNAIPLSADQIEITHGGCRGYHDDERDEDIREFSDNSSKTTRGWRHPKEYSPSDYVGRLGHLPDRDEVDAAHNRKGSLKPPFKGAEGRGDADPYTNGRNLGSANPNDSADQYCEHCEDDQSDHSSDDCPFNKWCSVCEEHGDHEPSEYHEWCQHCDDWAEHDSNGHEDEYGEHPDHMKQEGYCPSCNQATKQNYNQTHCQATKMAKDGTQKLCGAKLPDWGKLAVHGTPVPPDEYQAHGSVNGAEYGLAEEADKNKILTEGGLAAHLYHHHGSDTSGKAFEDATGDWNMGALHAHHQWLHHNPEEAEGRGFAPVEHSHPATFGSFKPHGAMTPEEVHAHMMLGHAGKAGGVGSFHMDEIGEMTPEEAVEAHKKAHDADDAVAWGEKDSESNLKPKITHTHDAEISSPLPGMTGHTHMPTSDALIEHLGTLKYHLNGVPDAIADTLKNHPGVAEALHQQMHENSSPASDPASAKFHVHDEAFAKAQEQHAAVKKHLIEDHGASATHYEISGQGIDKLMEIHQHEHGPFPSFDTPAHVHFGGVAHTNPEGHTANTMKSQTPVKELITVKGDPHAPGGLGDHVEQFHPELKNQLMKVKKFKQNVGQDDQKTKYAMDDLKYHHDKSHSTDGHPTHFHGFDEPGLEGAEKRKEFVDPQELKDSPWEIQSHVDKHHTDKAHLMEASDALFDAITGYGENSPQTQEAHQKLLNAHDAVHGPNASNHPHHYHYDHEKKVIPEGDTKTSSLRTLTDLFEEVAS